jgi:hypothetical protein
MRKLFQHPRRAGGMVLLTFAMAVLLSNGGEALKSASPLDDGFPLAGITPAHGASRPNPEAAPAPEEMWAEFSDDLPFRPAAVAYAVSDTISVFGGACAVFGLFLLRHRTIRPTITDQPPI